MNKALLLILLSIIFIIPEKSQAQQHIIKVRALWLPLPAVGKLHSLATGYEYRINKAWSVGILGSAYGFNGWESWEESTSWKAIVPEIKYYFKLRDQESVFIGLIGEYLYSEKKLEESRFSTAPTYVISNSFSVGGVLGLRLVFKRGWGIETTLGRKIGQRNEFRHPADSSRDLSENKGAMHLNVSAFFPINSGDEGK